MLVDVKLLTLLCVLKEGSYTAAAEALALSQPAVSYHIHQLEQEFHIKIFYCLYYFLCIFWFQIIIHRQSY